MRYIIIILSLFVGSIAHAQITDTQIKVRATQNPDSVLVMSNDTNSSSPYYMLGKWVLASSLGLGGGGGGATDLTIGGSGPTYIVESSTGTDVTIAAAGINTLSESPANTLVITGTEVDGSTTNEIQDITLSGTTTVTFDLSSDATDATVTGAGIAAISRSGNDITVTATEVDGSTTNEIQTLDASGTSTITWDLSSDATDITLVGAGISAMSRSGNAVTVTSTEVDGSTTNETNTIEEDNVSEQTGNLTIDFGTLIDVGASGTEADITLDFTEAQIDGGVEGDEYFLINDPDSLGGFAVQRYRIVDLTNEILTFEEDNSIDGSGNTLDFGTGVDVSVSGVEADITLDFNEFTTDAAIENDEFVILSDGAGVQEKVAISTFTTGNTIYTGDGTSVSDVDVSVTDSLEFNGTLKIINDVNDYVGIGAQTPQGKLHVRGITGANVLVLEHTDPLNTVIMQTKSVINALDPPFQLTVLNKDNNIDISGDYYQMGNITFSKASATVGGGAINFNIGYDSTNLDGVLVLKSRESGATDGLVNVAGGLRFKWRSDATAAATFNTGDYGITMTATGAKTATVPDAISGIVGQTFFVFNSGTSGDITISITGGSGDVILGDTVVAPNESVTITCPETGSWISN